MWIYRGTAFAYSRDPDFTEVSRSVDFWQDVIDRYYSKYKDLHRTHLDYIKTATTTGKLVSPFGREYLFQPKRNYRGELVWSENDITNWPNQGLGADVMAVARVAAKRRHERARLTGKFIATVHDSIVLDVPENEIEETGLLLHNVFLDLPKLITQAFDVEWNVPMLGEVSIGTNMKDLTEVKYV